MATAQSAAESTSKSLPAPESDPSPLVGPYLRKRRQVVASCLDAKQSTPRNFLKIGSDEQQRRALQSILSQTHTTSRMITRFLTSVKTTFSPFNPRSGKTARSFLSLLPPNARSNGMKIEVKMLPRAESEQPGTLALQFSEL